MHIFHDINGRYFVLLPEVWRHITEGHPEMGKHLKEIGGAIIKPNVVYQSKKNAQRHLY